MDFKFYVCCAISILIINSISALQYQNDDSERIRGMANFRGSRHGLDSIGENNLLRAIYRDKPINRDFLRINRGLDSLSGDSFGMAKRLDSLAGMSFGNQKRNLDEIDRSGFDGSFVKRTFDEIDRSEFDRLTKKREIPSDDNKSQK